MNDNSRPQKNAAREPNEEARLSPEDRRDLARAKRAARFVGLILPLVITVCGTLLMILWVPRLPDPTATHWNAAGEASDFGSPWFNVIGIGVTSLFVTALFLLQGVQSMQKPGAAVWSAVNRLFPAIILGAVTLVQAGVILMTIPQLDAADASEAAAAPWGLPVTFGIGILAGTIAFLLQPRVRIDRPLESDSEPMPLDESERAFWFGQVRPSAVYSWVLGGTLVLTAGVTAVIFVTGAPLWWLMLVFLIVIGGAAVTCSWFRVRIDETGIEARSVVGWPTFRVPAADIDRVAAAEIAPFAEFGGWGLRWVPGGFGIVMRTGEGIVVTRRDGRTFTVTVDDAETGAALLATAAKAASTRPEKGE